MDGPPKGLEDPGVPLFGVVAAPKLNALPGVPGVLVGDVLPLLEAEGVVGVPKLNAAATGAGLANDPNGEGDAGVLDGVTSALLGVAGVMLGDIVPGAVGVLNGDLAPGVLNIEGGVAGVGIVGLVGVVGVGGPAGAFSLPFDPPGANDSNVSSLSVFSGSLLLSSSSGNTSFCGSLSSCSSSCASFRGVLSSVKPPAGLLEVGVSNTLAASCCLMGVLDAAVVALSTGFLSPAFLSVPSMSLKEVV